MSSESADLVIGGVLCVAAAALVSGAIAWLIRESDAMSRRAAARQAAELAAQAAAEARVRDAWGAYQTALGELSREPADPERHRRALEAGRHYAALSRQGGAPTIYDEAAIANDLSAAVGRR